MSVKAYCESLNIVVPVKILTEAQLEEIKQKLFVEIKKKSSKPVKLAYYYRWIIQNTLENPDEFFTFVSKDPIIIENLAGEEENALKKIHIVEEITTSMYQGVINIYGSLDLDIIFDMYNRNLLVSPISSLIDKPLTTIPINKVFISDLHILLKSRLIGQDHAIESVVNSIKSKAAGLTTFVSLFFVGPTGVGKTQLAKLLSSAFKNRLIKINCGEMSHGHEHQKYIGSPPGFVGHSEKSYLKEKSAESSEWIFLFDEIEKASPKFFDFLLSLLDDGTVVDNLGETLNFKDSIFIFTSNEGIDQIKYSSVGFGGTIKVTSGIVEETIKKSLESRFRPEFLNRIDEIITFNQLSEDNIRTIIELELKKYPIVTTNELISYVLEGGYSVKYGVRNIERFIRKHIKPILADSILEYGFDSKTKYIPILTENKLTFLRENYVVDREIQAEKRTEKRRKKEAP